MSASAHELAALTAPERDVLRLKALIGPAATGKSIFMDCLNEATRPTPGWNTATLNPVVQKLRAQGFLTDDFACAPRWLHPLAVEAAASDQGEAMVAAIRAKLPLDGPRMWDRKALHESLLRWQRLAVLTNDEDAFGRAQSLPGWYASEPAPSIFIRHFAHIDVGAEWFASRRPAFQAALLAAKANVWIAGGAETPDFRALIEVCRRDPTLRALAYSEIADFDLLNGALGRLDETLADIPAGTVADLPVAFRAARLLLAGDVSAAVAAFAEALKLYRKAKRKRKGGLPGYVGVLHIAALLAADEAALHPEIEALTQANEGQLANYPLRALLEFARNKEAAARQQIEIGFNSLRVLSSPPFSTGLLAVAVALIWPKLARDFAPEVFVPLFRACEASMPLAAHLLAEALERTAPDPAPYRAFLARPDNEIAFRFLSLVAVKAPWERALESLEAMLSPPQPATPASAKARRLIWLVDPASHEIRPVEQALQARGWSGGRSVALKRLRQGDPALDYLDEFDRSACRLIYRESLGYYGQEHYECRADDMLPALIGHPRVFDLRSPAQPVELVAGRPELVLSSDAKGFRLSVSYARASPGVFLEIETPGRWRVVVVDERAIEAATIISKGGVVIPKSARARVAALARLPAPMLPLRIETDEIEDVAAIAGDPSPVLRLSPAGEGLKVLLLVRPAGPDGPSFLPGQGGVVVNAGKGRVRRDLEAERRLAGALTAACPSLGGDGPEWIFDDVAGSLELLAELGALPAPPAMEWPEGKRLAFKGEASFKRFKATVKGGESWFTLDGSVEVDEGLVLDLKDLLARMERMQGRFVALDNGAFIALDRQFRLELERLSRFGDGLKIPTFAGVGLRDLLDSAASVKSDPRWKAFVRRIDEAEREEPKLPAAFLAELRDYQREGFVWMSRLAGWGAGALLADDMGLGKTVQAIAVMVAKAASGPILVVAPTSVCGNWIAEIERFAPTLRTIRLTEAEDRAAAIGALGASDVLIVSYGLMAREQERLTAVKWAMAVLDEAQSIKNADTRRAEASRRLDAGFRLALTGTPVENDLDELWSLFAFVNPGLLGGRERFGKRFAGPIARDNDARAKAALRALVRPFLLRRTKTQVLAELPPRTEQTLLIEQDTQERAFYEALRRRALERLDAVGSQRTRIHILAEITKLRQACCHPALAAPDCDIGSAKLETFLDLVDNLREGRHRALVFSQFVGHLSKARAALDARGVSYQYLDGATPAVEREKRVAAFQSGAGDLFLISLKAGGFGLNLTAADYVIHLDPWWNPAVEAQASDRAHRIGQQRPVTIYRLIVKDSIEERIVALHRHKRDLADALLEGADASGRLSEEDLLDLIRGG